MQLPFKKPGRAREPSKAPARSRNKQFLPGQRFVLFIGDEGAILLYLKRNVVVSRQFVPDASDANLDELLSSLNRDQKSPISVVIDSMDQSYTQQTLPPVSALSVGKLIKRRLDRDFAASDIKNALMLGREASGRKDWNFLIIAIEKSRQLSKWLEFTLALPNRLTGIYLASVETEIILKKLEQALGVDKTAAAAKWQFFISHNKVGGFRQVFLRNGRIVFTRMSQPIGESTPEVIAGNIEQEMQSTIEYMKRLSYNAQDGLDIYIVAAGAVKPLVDKAKFICNGFFTLTPYELAQHLGIEGAQTADQFGDVVLAASIASSAKQILKFTTPESRKFDRVYQLSRAQRGAAALAILGLIGYAGHVGFDIYLKHLDAEDVEFTRKAHQRNLDNLYDEIKKSNLDVVRIGEIMEMYQLLSKQAVLPFSFLSKAQAIIHSPIVVKAVEWSIADKTASGNALLPPKAMVTFTLQFPGVSDPETFKALSKKVLDDLKASFKGFDIAFDKLPARYMEAENVSITFDNAPAPAPVGSQSPDVTLTFKEL